MRSFSTMESSFRWAMRWSRPRSSAGPREARPDGTVVGIQSLSLCKLMFVRFSSLNEYEDQANLLKKIFYHN
jgi:hypothetical protein